MKFNLLTMCQVARKLAFSFLFLFFYRDSKHLTDRYLCAYICTIPLFNELANSKSFFHVALLNFIMHVLTRITCNYFYSILILSCLSNDWYTFTANLIIHSSIKIINNARVGRTFFVERPTKSQCTIQRSMFNRFALYVNQTLCPKTEQKYAFKKFGFFMLQISYSNFNSIFIWE